MLALFGRRATISIVTPSGTTIFVCSYMIHRFWPLPSSILVREQHHSPPPPNRQIIYHGTPPLPFSPHPILVPSDPIRSGSRFLVSTSLAVSNPSRLALLVAPSANDCFASRPSASPLNSVSISHFHLHVRSLSSLPSRLDPRQRQRARTRRKRKILSAKVVVGWTRMW